MHSVQPEHIDIKVESESALAWVQTHWGQATRLKLTWLTRDIPWVMAHNAASVTSLKRLELRLLQERSPTTAMLLTWLLAQAPQLQLLFLQHPTALVLPPIRHLSHLIVATSKFTDTCAASIRQLRNLQTLWLGMEGPEPIMSAVDLDLRSLPQLSDVCVDRLTLSGITLPRQCRMHWVGDGESMFLDIWSDNARQGQLHSINLQSDGSLLPEQFLDFLPLYFVESKCSVLQWRDMPQFGRPANPALFDAAHFCCLTHLKLMSRDINILLPQELPLQVLHVHARSLSIVFENPKEQAKRLQQLKVAYRTLRGADVFVLTGLMCGMGALISREAVAGADQYHGFLVNSGHMRGDAWKCPCGACLGCLQQVEGY
ncbi:g3859 [Coccomyxa elongata]